MDGCLTPFISPHGEHKEDFSDRKARCSMLFIAITDTRRIRLFVGGFPGSRANSSAFRARSWYSAMEDPNAPLRPLSDGEFILGDSGFALTAFLVCCPHPLPPLPPPFLRACRRRKALPSLAAKQRRRQPRLRAAALCSGQYPLCEKRTDNDMIGLFCSCLPVSLLLFVLSSDYAFS